MVNPLTACQHFSYKNNRSNANRSNSVHCVWKLALWSFSLFRMPICLVLFSAGTIGLSGYPWGLAISGALHFFASSSTVVPNICSPSELKSQVLIDCTSVFIPATYFPLKQVYYKYYRANNKFSHSWFWSILERKHSLLHMTRVQLQPLHDDLLVKGTVCVCTPQVAVPCRGGSPYSAWW